MLTLISPRFATFPMRAYILVIASAFVVALQCAADVSVPLFTADYYLAKPKNWEGKRVTVAIAYVRPRNRAELPGGLRQFSAYTYNQNVGGGFIDVLATEAGADKLINLCGTVMQFTAAGVRTSMVQAVFTKDSKSGDYFLFIDK